MLHTYILILHLQKEHQLTSTVTVRKNMAKILEKLSKYVMDKYPTHLFSKRISLSYMTKKSKIDPMDADNED